MEAAESLFECLEQVADPRKARGVRHPFQAITAADPAGFGLRPDHHGPHRPLRQDALGDAQGAIGLMYGTSRPMPRTISRTLAGVPYEQLQGALTGWVARVVAD